MYTRTKGGRVGVPPVDDYRDWRKKNPAIGCRFAKVIAMNPPKWGQTFEVVPAVVDTDGMADAIAARVTTLFLPLGHVRGLVQAGNYREAMKDLDELQAMPNKTDDEITVIRQMREYVLAKLWLPADAQPH